MSNNNHDTESAEILTARALLETQASLENIYHIIVKTVAVTGPLVDQARKLLEEQKQAKLTQ